MTSREELKKLFKELCIRFDTDPKRYSKFDFGVLLRYLKGESTDIDSILNSLETVGVDINGINEILTDLRDNVNSNKNEIDSLIRYDQVIDDKIVGILNLLGVEGEGGETINGRIDKLL